MRPSYDLWVRAMFKPTGTSSLDLLFIVKVSPFLAFMKSLLHSARLDFLNDKIKAEHVQ